MKYLLIIILTAAFFGCTTEDDAGTGALILSASGGKALQEGFPYTENGTEYTFVDGWSLSFTKYIVTIGNIKLTNQDNNDVEGSLDKVMAIDLKKGSDQQNIITTLNDLPAKRLNIEFTFRQVSDKTENINVDEDDFEYMKENSLSYLIEGVATKDDKEVNFRFGLNVASRYFNCINGVDKTKGIVIERNKSVSAYIYAHALHLFWDTLASGDEDLRFDAFAAVAGDDDTVTEKELYEQDLTDLKDENGDTLRNKDGSKVTYNDNGILPYDDLTLEAFVNYAARAGVHFNGVGLCEFEVLEN